MSLSSSTANLAADDVLVGATGDPEDEGPAEAAAGVGEASSAAFGVRVDAGVGPSATPTAGSASVVADSVNRWHSKERHIFDACWTQHGVMAQVAGQTMSASTASRLFSGIYM